MNWSWSVLKRARGVCSIARKALGDEAEVVSGDLKTYSPPSSDAMTLIDVLHYLPRNGQEELLQRLAAALTPGGVLCSYERRTPMRAGASPRFAPPRDCGRSCVVTCGSGFTTGRPTRGAPGCTSSDSRWMLKDASGKTPFANTLLIATKT